MRSHIGNYKINSLIQLLVCFILLFIVPVFPETMQQTGYLLSVIALLLISASLVEKHTQKYVIIASILVVSSLINRYFDFRTVMMIENSIIVLFFTWIALLLIKQVMTKEPGIEIILEAISGYLLLGIALTFVMGVIEFFVPDSFSLSGVVLNNSPTVFTENSYFVFITYTTVGYGDILPINDIGRAFSKLVALCGQIYISVVIAILIGKYTQTKTI